jgi:hypothetical protein
MRMIDFSRSFLLLRIDLDKMPPVSKSHVSPYALNASRIPLECRCTITERASGASRDFALGASCKTERVGVEKDIWTEPNADFAPILSDDQFLIIKTYDRADRKVMLHPPSLGEQPHRQFGRSVDAFDLTRVDYSDCEAELLESADRIIEATYANEILVAQTEFHDDRYDVVLEYPVKTINVNERDRIYQTDTGPVLLPDLSKDPEDLISGLELAYSAFNDPTWIEFIVRHPSSFDEGVTVQHYCRSVHVKAQNRIGRLVDQK